MINRHGLRRADFTEAQKREVRQRCCFGCVICGDAIIDYHHFDPPFEDAKRHSVDGITLLCGSHHSEATRGLLSPATVKKRNLKPYGAEHGASHVLDLTGPVQLAIGTVLFTMASGPLIVVDDVEVLGFEVVEGELVLNAHIVDETGKELLVVRRNELTISRERWDATLKGREIRIRNSLGSIAFLAIIHPPSGLYVRSLDMMLAGQRLRLSDTGDLVASHNGVQSFSSSGLAWVTQGSIRLTPGRVQIDPQVAGIPFPVQRFADFARRGDFETLTRELFGPVLHLQVFREPMQRASDGERAPIDTSLAQHNRYTTFCDVCARALGTVAIPKLVADRPPLDGLVCSTCVARPVDGWSIKMEWGVIGCFKTLDEALARAQTSMNEIPFLRLVVHHEDGRIEYVPSR